MKATIRGLVDLWENGQASLGPGTISSRTRNMSVGFKYIFLNILHFVFFVVVGFFFAANQ